MFQVQVGTSILISFIGMVFLKCIAPRTSCLTTASLSFAIGAAVYGLASVLTVILLGGLNPVLTLGLITVACLIGVVLQFKAQKWSYALNDLLESIFGAFFWGGIASSLLLAPAVILSYDSYRFLLLSQGMLSSPDLSFYAGILSSYPIFSSTLHALVMFWGGEFYVLLPTLMSISGILFGSITLFQNLPLFKRIAGCLLFTLALGSSYFFVHQSLYINGHSMVAAYVLILFVLWWSAGVGLDCSNSEINSRRLAHVCVPMSLASIALLRFEGTLLLTLFLMIPLAEMHAPIRTRIIFVLSATSIPILWYGFLVSIGGGGSIVNSKQLYFLILSMFVPVVVALAPLKTSQRERLPAVTLFGLSVVTLIAIATTPNLVSIAIISTVTNLFAISNWGAIWPIICAGLLSSIVLPAERFDKDMRYIIASFFLLLIVLSSLRDPPIRVGWGDSVNRMLFHIAPISIFWITHLALRGTWNLTTESPRDISEHRSSIHSP